MSGLRFACLWLSPILLFGVAAQLCAGAPAGPLLALLLVLGPCAAVLGGRAERGGPAGPVALVLTLAAAVLLLSAGLSLIGDLAAAASGPRWRGVVIGAGCAFAVTCWPASSRWWPWLGPGALLAAWLVLAAVGLACGLGPTTAWARVASRLAFTFSAESPWVRSGATLPAAGVLSFGEPERIRAASPAVFGVIVSDRLSSSVQEWRPRPGAAITLRPGDRLSYPAGARMIFEPGTRVPGAPRSGAAWADPMAGASRPAELGRFLGLALTFLAGGLPLLRHAVPPTRRGAALGLGLALAGAGWTLGWAVYASWAAPELFLGALSPGSLAALPSLAVNGLWGRRLLGVLVGATIALFVAHAAGLRELIARQSRAERLAPDWALWSGVLGLALLGSLSSRDPWALLLLALGLLASTLGPLALASGGVPGPARALACLAGLAAFAACAVGGRAAGGAVGSALGAFPALLGAPAAWAALRLARRDAP